MEGRCAFPFGLNVGVPLWLGELPSLQSLMGLLLPDLVPSLSDLSIRLRSPFGLQESSKCRSPKEWERFQVPVCCIGPSRSSQLRLAGIGRCLWALRSPSKLKPFREGLIKKLLGNLGRWFLPFCWRVSVEMVMGRVG